MEQRTTKRKYFKHEKIVITSKENHRSGGGGMFEEYIIAQLFWIPKIKICFWDFYLFTVVHF